MTQWQELKETIIEMRDNDGTGTQQEVCKFLANLMDVLEKQKQEPCEDATLKDIFCMGCEYKEQEPCNDCISRQAVITAIEELKKIHFDRVVVLNKVRDRVLGLPPVNPTSNISIQITEREKYGRFN